MAGDYLLVWGEQDEDGFMEAELMDGRCVVQNGAARWLFNANFDQEMALTHLLGFLLTCCPLYFSGAAWCPPTTSPGSSARI